jgi:cellobiose transport system permease protein
MHHPRQNVDKLVTAYVYIAPFFLLFLVFGLFPILYSLFLSFTYWKGMGKPLFVAFDNYTALFQDATFFKALYNTAFIWIVAHLIILPGGFLVAYLLNTEYVKRKNLFQALFFTPMVTSTIAVSLVFSTMFGEQFGVLNFLLERIGLQPVPWFHGDGRWIKPVIILLFSWRWIGWNMVIYFAGMQGIDRELYECAAVEGANKAQILGRITVPLMKPVILYTLVLSFIGGTQIFDEPFILTGTPSGYIGGTNQAGLTLATQLYEIGFRTGNMGTASALAYTIMAIIGVLSAFSIRLFAREKRARA